MVNAEAGKDNEKWTVYTYDTKLIVRGSRGRKQCSDGSVAEYDCNVILVSIDLDLDNDEAFFGPLLQWLWV